MKKEETLIKDDAWVDNDGISYIRHGVVFYVILTVPLRLDNGEMRAMYDGYIISGDQMVFLGHHADIDALKEAIGKDIDDLKKKQEEYRKENEKDGTLMPQRI